ncbi:hypothetical protein GGI04_005213, partial [Coemansia thaxteri]
LQVHAAVLAHCRRLWVPAPGLRDSPHDRAAQEPPHQVEPDHRRAAHAPDRVEHAPHHAVHRIISL